MNSKKRQSHKIYIKAPSTDEETREAIEQMRAFCQGYLDESFRWMAGIKISGQRARRYMYNIVGNASTVNKAMLLADKRSKR
jgi:hypothetical protein